MVGLPIPDDAILDRLTSLPEGDRATSRANPFAVLVSSNELLTADHAVVSGLHSSGESFSCPKCRGEMRLYVHARGTPFFAHASARGSCPSGFETPAHLCIKRGLHSIGFSCEHRDSSTSFQFDAYHEETDTAVEVISSGTGRYEKKIHDMRASGRRCWWIADSGSRSLGSKDGSERICMRSFESIGHVIVSGLFKPKAGPLFSQIGNESLYAFYYGLIWKSCGDDRWQLQDEDHPLSKAATADDGMKHLMVRLHWENANVVTELKRKGINRRTWFDSKWRYRGLWTPTWKGDREYIVGLVNQLINDAKKAEMFVSRNRNSSGSTSANQPVHRSAEDVLRRITDGHSASFVDAMKLRDIANNSSVTNALSSAEISDAKPLPAVIDQSSVTSIPRKRLIVSQKWDEIELWDSPRRGSTLNANRQLQQISASKDPVVCVCGCDQFKVKSMGKLRWLCCENCGTSVGNSWVERRHSVRS